MGEKDCGHNDGCKWRCRDIVEGDRVIASRYNMDKRRIEKLRGTVTGKSPQFDLDGVSRHMGFIVALDTGGKPWRIVGCNIEKLNALEQIAAI